MIPTAEQMEFSARNRRLIAERTHWPGDAVDACEKLERELPAFEVCWFPARRSARPEFNREVGFYAWREGEQPGQMWGDTWRGRQEWYGATAGELAALMRAESR